MNALLLMGGAVFFLWNLEVHVKRRALNSLHELRSIATRRRYASTHQGPRAHSLTPGSHHGIVAGAGVNAVPAFTVRRLLLRTLALTSKLAALHARYLSDPVVLNAVNDVESLAGALSLKIWQKTMILDSTAVRVKAVEPV